MGPSSFHRIYVGGVLVYIGAFQLYIAFHGVGSGWSKDRDGDSGPDNVRVHPGRLFIIAIGSNHDTSML